MRSFEPRGTAGRGALLTSTPGSFHRALKVKCGKGYEAATGATLDEALSGVSRLVVAEFAGHVP